MSNDQITDNKEKEKSSEISFNAEQSWVMKLTKEGIFFNREAYPNAKPDDFAEAVIKILENEFTVKFEKNEPPYNKK